jgi:O-6-methylguanine DNA methyltransferase
MTTLTTVNFSKGPKIRVTLDFGDFQFKKASLSFSSCFECYIEGHAQKKDRDRLLAFLENYGKENPCSIELNLEHLSLFRKKALSCLQKVPFGEVLTYGELADKIGHPKAARAIGSACHDNPYPIFIPCHRVIASGKRLGGFATGLRMKKLLLDFEKG